MISLAAIWSNCSSGRTLENPKHFPPSSPTIPNFSFPKIYPKAPLDRSESRTRLCVCNEMLNYSRAVIRVPLWENKLTRHARINSIISSSSPLSLPAGRASLFVFSRTININDRMIAPSVTGRCGSARIFRFDPGWNHDSSDVAAAAAPSTVSILSAMTRRRACIKFSTFEIRT